MRKSDFLVKVYILSLVCMTVWLGCGNKNSKAGTITIKNDILDKEFNTFVVDELLTQNGLSSSKYVLKPGERVSLKQKRISTMRLLRKYADHSKVYLVRCPDELLEDITIKLIDVHTNRLSGGCSLEKRGVMTKGGFVKWD